MFYLHKYDCLSYTEMIALRALLQNDVSKEISALLIFNFIMIISRVELISFRSLDTLYVLLPLGRGPLEENTFCGGAQSLSEGHRGRATLRARHLLPSQLPTDMDSFYGILFLSHI